MTVEQFEPLAEPYDKYAICNMGYVIDVDTGLKQHIEYDYKTQRGYVVLDGSHKKSRKFYIYQLVADMFIPNPHNLSYVYFKDGDLTNASYTNLGYAINPQESKQRKARPLRAETAQKRTELICAINNAIDNDNWNTAKRLGIELWELEGNCWHDRQNQL